MKRTRYVLATIMFGVMAGPALAADAIADYSYEPSYCSGYEATSFVGKRTSLR